MSTRNSRLWGDGGIVASRCGRHATHRSHRSQKIKACVEQLEARLALSAAPFGAAIGLNFEAATIHNSQYFRPPDTMGTVGQDHIVELINGAYRVYDKLDGSLLQSSSLDTFWTVAGVNPDNFSFDPRVTYDPVEDRFYAAALDDAGDDNRILVAVSDDGNPLNGWTAWGVDSDSHLGQRWADFPQLSYDADGVYVGVNMYDIDGGLAYSDTRSTLVLPKSDLLSATPHIANRTLIEDHQATTGYRAQGVVYPYDTSGLPAMFVSRADEDTFRVARLNGPVTSPSFSVMSDISVYPRDWPPLADQPSDAGIVGIETDGRINNAITYHNGTYWGVHGVEDPVTHEATFRMFQLNAAPNDTLQDTSLFTSTLDMYYPSIAVSGPVGSEDVVIGFTGSSDTVYPSAYAVIGKTVAGDTDFSAPFQLHEGTHTYEYLIDGRNRWGDYSATVVDPEDPNVFWTFQEYSISNDDWATRITQIILDGVPTNENYVELNPFGDYQGINVLGSASDVDTYVFASDKSGTVQIDATEDLGDFDLGLRLWDLDEAVLVDVNLDGLGDDAQITSDIPLWDLYSAEVFSESGDGVFEIVIDAPSPTISGIPLDAYGDGTDAGQTIGAYDADYFQVVAPVTADGTLQLNLNTAPSLNGVLSLYDAAGNRLQRSNSSGSGGMETISYTGVIPGDTYYARVGSANYASTGAFTISFDFGTYLPTAWTGIVESYIPFSANGVSNDIPVRDAYLDTPGDTDSYYFAGDVSWGGSYTIRVGDLGLAPDPVVAVYDDSSGNLVGFNNDYGGLDDAQLTVSLISSVRYVLVVADAGTATGDLTIDITAPASTTPVVIDIAPNGSGSSVGEIFPSSDTDFRRMTAPPNASGDLIVKAQQISGTTLDPAIFLFDDAGNLLDRDVHVGVGNVALIEYSGVVPSAEYNLSLLSDDYATTGTFQIDVTFGLTGLPGDFNGDNAYTCEDVNQLVHRIVFGPYAGQFDLNGDGSINTPDLDMWLDVAAAHDGFGSPYLPGDANLDGVVDGQDFIDWNTHKFQSIAAWCAGDFNADGVVDGQDFIIWNTYKFQSSSPLAVVPSIEVAGTRAVDQDRDAAFTLAQENGESLIIPPTASQTLQKVNRLDAVFARLSQLDEGVEERPGAETFVMLDDAFPDFWVF